MLRTKLLPSLLLAAVVLDGCAKHNEGGTPDAYVENGVLWAFGSVQLTMLEAPGSIMLKRLTAVESVDTPQFELYGAYRAGGPTGARDVAYVDQHPGNEKFLAYSYQLDYTPRSGDKRHIDVWAVLKRPGRSYYGRQRVYLGAALFQADAVFAAINFAEGLKLSAIADGVYSGQWALHYPDAPMIVTKPWSVTCDKHVSQMPGQNASQNPAQFDQCRPLPAQQDLCNGDPTKCRPKPPVQKPATPDAGNVDPAPGATLENGLEVVDEASRVYAMPAELASVKIAFTSTTLAAASDEENMALCARKFMAVARTVDRQVNTACNLVPAPSAAKDGKLSCALTLSFDAPQTYLDKVCDVTVVFRGAAQESQRLQILKR